MVKFTRALLLFFAFTVFSSGLFGAQPNAKTPEEVVVLVEAHKDLILGAKGTFYRVLKNYTYNEGDIEEIAWDALLKAAKEYEPERGTFEALYGRIFRNKLVDYSRRGKVRKRNILQNSEHFDWTTTVSAPHPQPTNLEKVREFWKKIQGLVPYSVEFELTQFRGIPYSIAATTLGIPEGTLKSRVHKCRIALAEVARNLNIQKSDFLDTAP